MRMHTDRYSTRKSLRTASALLTAATIVLSAVRAPAAEGVFMLQPRRFVRVLPLFQTWFDADRNNFYEFSTPVYAYFPLSNETSVSLFGSQASAGGDRLEGLGGITDTQIHLTHYIESSSLILNAAVNLPTGKRELSTDEFWTSYLLSLDMYDFQIPAFGQGWNLTAGASWALPAGEQMAFGIGLSYTHRGGFKPFEGMSDLYVPGNEILFTGGFDYRMNPRTTLAADVVYTLYGNDRLDDEEVYASGNKIAVNLQMRMHLEYNELWILARYRSKAKNEIAIAGNFVEEAEKTIPDQFDIRGRYLVRWKPGFHTGFFADVRFFQEAATLDRASLLGLGVEPRWTLPSGVSPSLRIKLVLGSIGDDSITGLEIGGGLTVHF